MNNIIKITVTLWIILLSGKVIAQQLASSYHFSHLNLNQNNSQLVDSKSPSFLREDSTESFRKNFPALYQKLLFGYRKVEAVRYTVSGNSIYIQFNNARTAINTVYSIKGKQQYTIIHMAKTLSNEDSLLVHSRYPDYTVYDSKEIQSEGNSILQVILENRNGFKVINIANKEIYAIKDINK